ncbi:MAG TPA: glycosyltransferase family 2 protein [Candidatus Nanoarchaeia archaeon]|nr:glycosyltransferase family 2 protein [Candidatus Nanoarchaeia archaeon]
MLQYVLWGISFITLWLTIVWLNFLYAEKPSRKHSNPSLTIAIPVYSVDNNRDPVSTIRSIFASGYKGKLDVIVVDDGSTDDTFKVLQKFNEFPVRIFRKPNGGKASALNLALKHSKGEFFAVVDSDSRIGSGSIDASLPHFVDKKIGAVISRVRVDSPRTFLESIQRFEYIMSGMIRKIWCNFGTLSITPGVLSIYRTAVLHKLGGFTHDKTNLTEDLEIALRLKHNGYQIFMEPDSVTYTKAPDTISGLWRQRIRWTRGYIYNHWNYRKMFFSSKHGLFGMFQLPINVLAVILLIANVSIIGYDVGNRFLEFTIRSITIPDYFITTIFDFPSLKELILARNVQILLPVALSFVCGMYLIVFAHRMFKEKLFKNLMPIVMYTFVMPYFATVNWIASVAQEVARAKRKW